MSPRKTFFCLVLLLALVIGISYFTGYFLKKSAQNLEKYIESMEEGIRSEKWDEVEKQLATFEKEWSRAEKIWALLVDHFEIDNMSTTLAKVANYIDSRDKALILGEMALLKQYLRHIPETETLKLKNIF